MDLSLGSFLGFGGLFLLVPVVIGFTAWVKQVRTSLTKPKKALVAMTSALVFAEYLGFVAGGPWQDQLWWGVLGGLAACKVYDLGKKVVLRDEGRGGRAAS